MLTFGHVTKMLVTPFDPPWPENPMIHANFMALCFIELELLPTEVLHYGNRDLTFSAPVTLTQ